MVGLVIVHGLLALLFVVEVLKAELEAALTLNHNTEDRTVLETKRKLETVIRILVKVTASREKAQLIDRESKAQVNLIKVEFKC